MSTTDAQKSEIHAVTADASTSPTAASDIERTHLGSHDPAPTTGHPVEPTPTDALIVRDDTDDGGPLVIQSADPALSPPRVPVDPFPTDRTPEVDPPAST